MGHRLSPKSDADSLLPSDVVARLYDFFPNVSVDSSAGASHVDEMIAQYQRMQRGFERWKDPPPEAIELTSMIERLESLRSDAISVSVTDAPHDENRSITFTLIPGEDILIGYASQQHEEKSTEIVMRIADAISYDVSLL